MVIKLLWLLSSSQQELFLFWLLHRNECYQVAHYNDFLSLQVFYTKVTLQVSNTNEFRHN